MTEIDGVDLTPRVADPRPSGRRRILPTVLLAVVVAGLVFVLFRTLGDAALFFYNADEAIERRVDLEGQRIRVQGTPFTVPAEVQVERDGRFDVGVAFPIRFEGEVIDVVHVGSPAELFQPGVPVVLEGTWVAEAPAMVGTLDGGANDGWYFASTEMVVKHDNEYRIDNEDRLGEAERGGFVPEP